MTKLLSSLIFFIFPLLTAYSQSSSILTDRVRFPKMTSIERTALDNLEAGDTVFDTDFNSLFVHSGTHWLKLKNEISIENIVLNLGETFFNQDLKISVDSNGNIYLGGLTTSGDVIIDNFNISSSGSNNLFLVKLDPTGNKIWHKVFGGTDEEQMGAIKVDNYGNIYFTGNFRSNFTNGNTTFTGNSSDFDVFLSKFDTNGNHLWSVRETSIGNFSSSDFLVVDSNGNPTIAGKFAGNSTFENTTISSSGNFDIYIAQYSSTGNLNWVKKIGGGQQDLPQDLKVNSSNKLLICGYFSGTISMNAHSISSSYSGIDVFSILLDSNGNAEWLKAIGGIDSEQEIKADFTSDGGFIVALKTQYSFTFQSILIPNNGHGTKIVMLKLDNNGNHVWHKMDFFPINSSLLYLNFVGEKDGSIYLVGGASFGIINVGDLQVYSHSTTGIIANYNSVDGEFNWLTQAIASMPANLPSVEIGQDNSLNITGSFVERTSIFDKSLKTNNLSNGLPYIKLL